MTPGFVVTRPQIPRAAETPDRRRARLLYQSRKRGIKENDLIMGTFAHKHLHEFDEDQLKEYDMILNEHDNEWDMYNCMVGNQPVPEYLESNQVMTMLIQHAKNSEKEWRIELPALRGTT